MELKEWGKMIHQCAVDHGWWPLITIGVDEDDVGYTLDEPVVDVEARPVGEIYMNIASEVSEAWEHWRNGTDPIFMSGDKPDGELIELADTMIRILDYCHVKGWDIEMAMQMKYQYNMNRPFRHGGKKA